MTVDLERARALFRNDERNDNLGWIVDRLRARLERGEPLTGRLRLAEPTSAQREALDRLVGRRPTTARSISLDLTELEAVLARAGISRDLRALVEALDGPIVDRAAAAAAERARWAALYGQLRSEASAVQPALRPWVDDLANTGLLRRLGTDVDDAERLTRQALAVLGRLPAPGIPLAQLAAAAVGNSHALDDGSPLGTLVLRALETITRLPRPDRGARERRALWARMGVLLDELSAPALVFGLRPGGDSLLARTLRSHADAGEPCRVTLRQLVRHPADWAPLARTTIVVCENPSVVTAAADRLGAASAPLLCTDGQPTGAVQTLLAQLAGVGATLRFHTDFDRGGIRIGNLLAGRFGARPWRMSRADYEAAAHARGVRLTASPEAATWDHELAPAIIARGLAIHEEQLLDALLADLAAWPPQPLPE